MVIRCPKCGMTITELRVVVNGGEELARLVP